MAAFLLLGTEVYLERCGTFSHNADTGCLDIPFMCTAKSKKQHLAMNAICMNFDKILFWDC
jgi:hypothetical protein